MRSAVSILAGIALAVGAALPAAADQLDMPAPTSMTVTAAPAKGMSMSGVLKQFGEPSLRHGAVGGSSRQQPPITRWDYPQFTVFFEYDHVVDSVVKGEPAIVQNTQGLQ